VILHDVFSVDEAHNKAMKFERLQNRGSLFKSIAENLQQYKSSAGPHRASNLLPVKRLTPLRPTRQQKPPPQQKDKENPYAKPGVAEYYRCSEPGHKSNECPKRS